MELVDESVDVSRARLGNAARNLLRATFNRVVPSRREQKVEARYHGAAIAREVSTEGRLIRSIPRIRGVLSHHWSNSQSRKTKRARFLNRARQNGLLGKIQALDNSLAAAANDAEHPSKAEQQSGGRLWDKITSDQDVIKGDVLIGSNKAINRESKIEGVDPSAIGAPKNCCEVIGNCLSISNTVPKIPVNKRC